MSEEPKQNAGPPAADAKQPKAEQPKSDQPQDGTAEDAAPEGSDKDDRRTKESVRRVAAAAGKPGSTAEKLRQRKESRQNLKVGSTTTVRDVRTRDGIVAGRDVVSIYAVPPVADDTYEVSLEDRVRIGACYVVPPSFATLVAFCADRPVTVVRVVPGQGKAATALRVASEIGSGPIYRLSPKKGLDQLDAKEIAEDAVYVLTGLDQDRANTTLNQHELRKKAAELGQKGARLLIAVSTTTRLRLGSVDYVTELRDTPACRDVLGAHLDHLVGTAAADELLASPELAGLLDTELTADAGPHKAVLLANLLAEAHRAGRAPADTVTAAERALRRRKKQEFDDWFAQLGGLDEYGLVIALAVLNRMPYEMIANAGRLLEDLLTKPPHGSVQNLPREQVQPFRRSLTARLTEFEAKLVDGAAGEQPGVMFTDPDRPSQVLLHVWHEYGDAHWAVVDWLRELGRHEVEEVRVRAGVAVGMLASVAYDYLLHTIVEQWADSRDEESREVAAVAVDAVNSDPALKERAHTLAREWCAKGTPNQVATGIRVYGGSVGLDHPNELFDALDEQAESDDPIVLDALFRSLTELAAAGEDGVSDRALMTTLRWATSRNRDRRATGSIAFLLMAADLLWPPKDTTAGEPDPGAEERWPLLLRVAEISAEWREVVARLWAAALFELATADVAVEILDRWAERVEADGARRAAFVRLLRATSTSDRVRARLRRAVDGWSDRDNAVHAPLTAAELAGLGQAANSPGKDHPTT